MKTTINLPQPVTVEYSDAAFYEMIEQYENPHFSESFVTQLIEAAPHYIKIIGEPKTDKSNMPPMTLPDIVLFCQKDIMKRLIEKYQS